MPKCDIKDCVYEAKLASHIKRHKADIHNIEVIWYPCTIPDCEYKCKRKYGLKQHKRDVHNINVKWYICTIPDCQYKCKRSYSLKDHLVHAHNINVKWHICKIDNCSHKCKTTHSLKQHLADIHNIDVKWHVCKIDDCNYRCKRRYALKQHLSNVHDIGSNQCIFCVRNRNSSIPYKDQYGTHKICKECYKQVTGKSTRVEYIWSDYIDENIGTEYLNSSDKSLRAQGGCQLYRPDKLYIGINLVEIDECDEHQHKWNSGTYKCDERRISEIYEEDGICGKTMVVIRWNPHTYKLPKGHRMKFRKERLKMMVQLKFALRQNPPKDKIHIYYMFYDDDNPRIAKNIPYTMIRDESDIISATSQA